MVPSPELRIAHVCKSFSPTSETFIHDYVTELHALDGLDCHVVTLARLNEAARPFPNVHVVVPRKLASPRAVGLRLRDTIRTAWHGEARTRVEALHREIRSVRPDVVHAHFGPAGVIALGATDAPLIVSFHGYDVSEYLQRPEWTMRYERLWKRAAAVTVVSHFQRKVIAEAGCPEEKVHVVRVGKRTRELRYEPPQHAVRRFVSVGRFTDKKGHLDAVQAIARARRAGSEVVIELVGDGPRFDDIASYVREHDLGEFVSLVGARPYSEVIDRMRAADAFILCSKTAANGDQEGVPTVLMEAQALGLPCISTVHAGIPEVIPEANHFMLAAEGDVEGIAERVRRLTEASVPDLEQWTHRGRERIEREFELSTQANRLAELYRALRRS